MNNISKIKLTSKDIRAISLAFNRLNDSLEKLNTITINLNKTSKLIRYSFLNEKKVVILIKISLIIELMIDTDL